MLRFLNVAAVAVLAVSVGIAQTPANHGGMGKMGGHADSHQAAENPAHRYFLSVYTLPEMREELGLSAQQVAQLRQYREEFTDEDSVNAAEKQLAAAEAVGKMKGVLTPTQGETFAAIQPAELHSIAMSRLTAEDSGKLMAELSRHDPAAHQQPAEQGSCKMMGGGAAPAGGDAAGADHSHH